MIHRLSSLMARAAKGEELTLAFLGGSITQGSLASTPETCYAFRVYDWFRRTFPQSCFHYVNGGIGGTNSHYGVSRAVTDVLMYQPDLVIVDFSVNDVSGSEGFELTGAGVETFFQETYEGTLRRLLAWPSSPAVLVLCNTQYSDGMNREDIHVPVADHYGVPHVSVRDTIYADLLAGKYALHDITPDGLHPNDPGHALVAEEIIRKLKEIAGMPCAPLPASLPDPLTRNRFESARRLTICNACPRLHGFRADTQEKTGLLDHFKNGWIGKQVGDRIHFDLENISTLAVQYRKSVRHPACVALLTLDGRETVVLDGNFTETWGDCLYLEDVLDAAAPGAHTADLEIIEAAPDAVPFYLMSLIVS
ncbi:MAG: SGNH/GDSL hydrolase family protein [Clostridia bacterium]|nr:SGNH/GDSL hydrolase family protein [Clostridia bacterium]